MRREYPLIVSEVVVPCSGDIEDFFLINDLLDCVGDAAILQEPPSSPSRTRPAPQCDPDSTGAPPEAPPGLSHESRGKLGECEGTGRESADRRAREIASELGLPCEVRDPPQGQAQLFVVLSASAISHAKTRTDSQYKKRSKGHIRLFMQDDLRK